jgi:hypothetical protein
MSCESTIPSPSACFSGPGPFYRISVACFVVSIYTHSFFGYDFLRTHSFFGYDFLRTHSFFGYDFLRNACLDVPSFDSPSSLYGCLSLMRHLLHCHWSTHFLLPLSFYCCWLLVLWSFVTCCSSDRLSVCVGLPRLIVSSLAWLHRLWRLFMLLWHSRCRFWIIIFFVVLSFFKCNAIHTTCIIRGSVKEY